MTRTPAALLALLVAGCGQPPAPPPPESSGDAGFPITVTDGLGRSVTVPRRPEKIVSIAPAMTETLFAVGAGPRVAAVTTSDSYPPEVKTLPTVGGFSPKTVSTEAVLALRPDLVVTAGKFHQQLAESLARLGLTVVSLEPNTLEEVSSTIELIGRISGCEPRAGEVAADFRRRLAAVRTRTAAAGGSKPKVLFVLWDDPLQTAGPGTFIGQMITAAGGVNLFADASQQYPRVGDEAVIVRDPDLILAPDHRDAADVNIPSRLVARPGWDRLTAVKHGRVRPVTGDLVNRAGPRLIDGLELVEQLVREAR
jgi:iron complex transport system substrate-binding protein